jgi:hypothetical protein
MRDYTLKSSAQMFLNPGSGVHSDFDHIPPERKRQKQSPSAACLSKQRCAAIKELFALKNQSDAITSPLSPQHGCTHTGQ